MQKRSLVLAVLVGLLLSVGATAMAAVIHVDAGQSDDTGDGTSWGTAKKYLQSALSAAISGDEIWVATGTYYPDEGTGQTDNARASAGKGRLFG